jgi:uncharacterized protein
MISGQRGVGKPTAMIQYIHSFVNDDILNAAALYVPVDHFLADQGSAGFISGG